MAQCSESNHRNGTVSSQSLTNTQLLITSTCETPTLPFDLIQEILSRLPVKFLLQLRCICKSWKSLISHPKFVKKHLRISKTSQHTHHLLVGAINNLQELVLWDFPIPYASIPNIITQTQIEFPTGNLKCTDNLCLAVCSCDGILCFTTVSGGESAILWNPSIRRFNILPPLKFSSFGRCFYSFGYDRFIDNYKVVAVSFYADFLKVNIHTMGADYWRMNQDLPYSNVIRQPGVIVNGSDQVLMYFKKFMELTLAVYDSKNDTLNIPMFPNICPWLDPKVYVESLISPCS
ncbi:F-box/kelch-repeat protein [Trifolium repens]|nr:F-box/kelch-repeat protein [Trifolium repens]